MAISINKPFAVRNNEQFLISKDGFAMEIV